MAPKLLPSYDSEDQIPDGYRPLYAEHDGKWVFEGGTAPDPTAGDRLKEFRTTNIELQKELEATKQQHEELRQQYAALGDPERIKKAQEALQKIDKEEERRLAEEGEYDKLVDRRYGDRLQEHKQVAAQKDQALKERDGVISKLKAELGRRTIQGEVDDLIERAGYAVRKGARKDLYNRAMEVFEVNDDGERVPRKGMLNADGDPITPEEFVTDLTKTADHLFVASGGGGAGGSSGTPAPTARDGILVAPDALAHGQNLEKIASGEVKVQMRGASEE